MGLIKQWLGLEDGMSDQDRETVDLTQEQGLPVGEQYATGAHEEHFTGQAVDDAVRAADAIAGARADEVYFDDRQQQTSFGEAGPRLDEMASTSERRYMGVPGLDTSGVIPVVGGGVGAEDDAGERCEVCGGRIPTDHELLTEILGWLGPAGEAFVHEFYVRLFEAAPQLRSLFPDDIKIQEEKLLTAIISLLQLFKAGDEQMEQLNSALARFGRSHTRFDPAATIEEYSAVWTVLAGVATDMLGDKLTPRHVAALRRAYEYGAGMMLAAQATARLAGHGRRRRTV